jgi:ABC transport system ATP-binding/permease protein
MSETTQRRAAGHREPSDVVVTLRGAGDVSSDEVRLKPAVLFAGRRHRVGGGLAIGSGSGAGLVLAGASVAPRHCVIEPDGRGGFSLTDVSEEGTLVNGALVWQGTRPLSPGDTVQVGDHVLHFLSGGEAAQPRLAGVHQESIALDREVLVLGRHPESDIVLDHPNVAPVHAEIRATADGAQLVDRSPHRERTLLNGRVVTRAIVRAGDQISIGPYRLVFDGATVVARGDVEAGLRVDAVGVSTTVKRKTILEPTYLSIEPGEFVAIIGESGAGKSTLLRALAGVDAPSAGAILVNGEPVQARLADVGYVPQDEIVHPLLTTEEALVYAARLRLPDSAAAADVFEAVARVLRELGLAEHAATRIGSLSGGQRKRVGVASELLNRPGLLFLDEPTTGLDPGLEAQSMRVFRDLASNARSVVLVTHATRNLQLCDKVAVMGRGGHLCFWGTPMEALEFFGVDDFDEIYVALDRQPAVSWRQAFEASAARRHALAHAEESLARLASIARPRPMARRSLIQQWRLLTSRYIRLLARDRRNLAIVLGQVPVLGLLVAALFSQGVFTAGDRANDAANVLFLLVTVAVWFGAVDGSREIVKELGVLRREHAVGMRLGAYLASKIVPLVLIAGAQAVVLGVIVLAIHSPGADGTGAVGLLAILAAGAALAVLLGLLVSCVASTEDQATSFIPLALIPQLLLGGAIVSVPSMSAPLEAVAGLAITRWLFASAGSAMDMETRIATDEVFAGVSEYGDFFALSSGQVMIALGFLAAVLAVGVWLLLFNKLRILGGVRT